MTAYTSKTPRMLNHDPHPITAGKAGGRIALWEHELLADRFPDAAHDPRPEFDHEQHNEPNPILIDFRRMIRDDWDMPEGLLWLYAGSWVDLIDEDPHMSKPDNWGPLTGTTQPAIDHARRVLTRLAALGASA